MARAIITILGAVITAAIIGVFAVTYAPAASKQPVEREIQQQSSSNAGVDYEKQYRDGALEIGKTVTNGTLVITVQRMGNYYYDGYGIYFRVDMQIQNTGAETARVPQYYYITDQDSRQYQGDTHQFSDDRVLSLTDKLAPGESIEKFKLFRMMPSSEQPRKLVMIDPATPDDSIWLFHLDQ